ncbi:MAG TPA: FtsX-like permease family protein, partial [Mycobacteriales bacterium]|nr:FtsX-like permease family protein [Mycobacteriales bacterium]
MSVQSGIRDPALRPREPGTGRVAGSGDAHRPRTGGGVWMLPPWRRAPVLPFGQPAVLLAVIAAAAILACAAASAPLFLSSASSAALQRLIGNECPSAATASVKNHSTARNLPALDARVRPAMTGAGLAAPHLDALAADNFGLDGLGGPPVRVAYRADAVANLTHLPGAVGGTGVWLPKYVRDRLGVRPGAEVAVNGTPVRVAGYYPNFYDVPLPAYWCSYGFFVLPKVVSNDVPPPLVLASDPATFTRLVGSRPADYDWVSPVDSTGETVSRGYDVAGRQDAAYHAAGLPVPRDFGRTAGGTGQLPTLTDRAVLIRNGLRGPVLPIALGGTLLALLLVGAAGSYWADRRRAEVRLLSARGVGPGALAGKAVLELALPAALGTLLGAVLARWLVGRLGPSPDLDPSAYRQAAVVAGGGLLAGL